MKYTDIFDQLIPKLNRHEYHADDVRSAIKDLQETDPHEDTWSHLASQTEQERYADLSEGSHLDPNHAACQPHQEHISDTASVSESIPHTYEQIVNQLTTSLWHNMFLTLNDEQYSLYRYLAQWCADKALSFKPPSFQNHFTFSSQVEPV